MKNYQVPAKDRSSISQILLYQLSLNSSFLYHLMFSFPWMMYFLPGIKTSSQQSAICELGLSSPHHPAFRDSTLCTAGKGDFVSRVIGKPSAEGRFFLIFCSIPPHHPTLPSEKIILVLPLLFPILPSEFPYPVAS